MHAHHQAAIDRFVADYRQKPWVLALILGGSLAHGFAGDDSDIDICVVATDGEFERRRAAGRTSFSLRGLDYFADNYIDCKVADLRYLRQVAERGSDPARYAFQDGVVLYSEIDGLDSLLEKITAFPESSMEDRRQRFAAQVLAWKWYYGEGIAKRNRYVTTLALQKLVLFTGRLVLNENRLLYPYHKWLLRVLEQAPRKPPGIMAAIDDLLDSPTPVKVNALVNPVFELAKIREDEIDWPNHFIRDSEQNWIAHEAPIDDL